jgi:membrane dipeptidase
MERPVNAVGERVSFFDAHCDTIATVLDQGADFFSGASMAHVSLPRREAANVRVQVFACCAVYPDTPPDRLVDRGERMIASIGEVAAASGGRMRVATSSDHLREASVGGPIAAIIALEGADPLEGRAENLRRFVELGVRSLVPAWKDNAFGGTSFGTNTGLTREGERLLGLAEELRVVVDVSHSSDRAFDEILLLATRPFVASHSNCRALCPHPRNLTDAMIRRLADRGGVMGINLASHFLDPECSARWASLRAERGVSLPRAGDLVEWSREIPRPPIDWIARHVVRAMAVGGEECVGLGGDLDGIVQTPRGIDTVADYVKVPEILAEAGLSSRQIEKVCFRNFERVFQEVLPKHEDERLG